MLNIKKDEFPFDCNVKERLEYILNQASREARFINGSAISIDSANLPYVELHKLFIGKHLFLFFNYSMDIYYQSLFNKIDIRKLYSFIKILDWHY